MAEAIVSTTVEMLRDLLIQEVSFLSGVRDQVQELQEELERIQCFLKDADKMQNETESVRKYVRSIKNFAYKIEDVIETYAIKVESRRGKGIKKALRRFACILEEARDLHKLGLEIGDIRRRIANLTSSLQTYGIKPEDRGQSSNAARRNLLRETFAHEIEEYFVGMQDDVDILVSLLTDGDKDHRIISICGMGGSGKTTLAKHVFNDGRVQSHFQFFAWVAVSQQFNAESLLQEILRQLDPRRSIDDIKKMEYRQLVQELCHVQRDQKCLVVLDDIWKTEDWAVLSHAFVTNTVSCKVLLTTRIQEVAEKGVPHRLNLFSEEEGWDLLKKKALASADARDSCLQVEQENLGKQMVCKCGFLPLAISVIGGILGKKKTLEEWENVNRDIDSYLRPSEGVLEQNQQVMQILALSYEDLPYQLKPCFLHLALYPEDAEIEIEPVCWMWIAEGMVSSKDQRRKETLVEVAKRYLLELASRSLIQVESYGSLIDNKYRLHDLVRDLCLRKCEEEDFVKVIDLRGKKQSISNTQSLESSAYRLGIYGEDDVKVVDKIIQEANRSIRTLSFWYPSIGSCQIAGGTLKNLGMLRFLRAVMFRGLKFSNPKLLDRVIKKLIHVRNLSIADCTLEKLPSSIVRLPYLQSFIFIIHNKVEIPNVFWKLKKLVNLILAADTLVCKSKLRLDCLNELETLAVIGSEASFVEVKDLKMLTNLRKFTGCITDNESLSMILDFSEVSWHNIQEILLIIEGGCDFSSADGSIMLYKLLMCCGLRSLTIRVRVTKLPKHDQAMFGSSNLVYLCLDNTSIEEDPMLTLEKLPKLRELILWRCFVGEEMTITSTGFHSLRELELGGLVNLKKWRIDEGAMPNISKIIISQCPKLEMIPGGMAFLKSLKILEIDEMPGKFVTRIRLVDGQEGTDFHKVCHVPFIKFS